MSKLVLVPRTPTKRMLHAAAKALSPERRPTKDWMSVSEKHAYRYQSMIEVYVADKQSVEDIVEVLKDCAAVLPRYRHAGETTTDDEELAALLDRVATLVAEVNAR